MENGENVASGKSDSEAELGSAPQSSVRIPLQPAVATGESFWSPRHFGSLGGGGRCHLAGAGRTEARTFPACSAQCGPCWPHQPVQRVVSCGSDAGVRPGPRPGPHQEPVACAPVSCLFVLWFPASLALHLGPGLTEAASLPTSRPFRGQGHASISRGPASKSQTRCP